MYALKGLILIIGLFASNYLIATASKSLSEAIQNKTVLVKWKGAERDTTSKGEYSSHYGACISLEITNLSTEIASYNVAYGYKLEPLDTSIQTMMVTQSLPINLAAKQKKKYRLYAMCAQAHDGGPSAKIEFKLGKRFTGNVLNIAALLNQKNYQGIAAQNAVWCLTDNYSLHTIIDNDTSMMYDLRRFVAKAKGIDIKDVYKPETESTRPAQPIYTSRTVYSGSISYASSRSSKIMIALFDENNKMKTVYVNNELHTSGDYTYKYNIGSDEMEQGKHYLRLFRDGKLEEEISIIPN